MIKLTQLLRKISEVLINEKARHEELRKRGESFNVFDILGLSTNEVRLHSAFLAELLNPNGTHGLGSQFLFAFIINL